MTINLLVSTCAEGVETCSKTKVALLQAKYWFSRNLHKSEDLENALTNSMRLSFLLCWEPDPIIISRINNENAPTLTHLAAIHAPVSPMECKQTVRQDWELPLASTCPCMGPHSLPVSPNKHVYANFQDNMSNSSTARMRTDGTEYMTSSANAGAK